MQFDSGWFKSKYFFSGIQDNIHPVDDVTIGSSAASWTIPDAGVIFTVYTHANGSGLIFCFFLSYPYDDYRIV